MKTGSPIPTEEALKLDMYDAQAAEFYHERFIEALRVLYPESANAAGSWESLPPLYKKALSIAAGDLKDYFEERTL